MALGAAAWTLAEYVVHRALHDRKSVIHIAHHAHPDETILDTAWQVYASFAVVYVLAGPSFTAGVLASYGWYLYVHHCTHHRPTAIPSALLRHHEGHHRYARRNFGVSTTLWDSLMGTRLVP